MTRGSLATEPLEVLRPACAGGSFVIADDTKLERILANRTAGQRGCAPVGGFLTSVAGAFSPVKR